MKLQFLKYTLLFLIISCSAKPKILDTARCFVKYDSLFNNVDTTKLEITRNTDSAAVEVLDRPNEGEQGIFRFDQNGKLRLYAFLENDHNDTNFFIEYDSLGNHKRSTSQEVVQWNFFKKKDSMLRFEFLLCAVDYNYGDIKILAGKYKSQEIKLFKSKFLKLIGANMQFNFSNLDSSRKIYITGSKEDKCSKKIGDFIDSAVVPKEL
jgi:hypothetical protein